MRVEVRTKSKIRGAGFVINLCDTAPKQDKTKTAGTMGLNHDGGWDKYLRIWSEGH